MLEKVRDKQTEGKSGMDSEIQKQSKKRQETRSFSICRISLLFIQVAERQSLCPACNSTLHKELEGNYIRAI